jgi:hypothetical protein
MRVEFSKKSRSKRRKIFKARVSKLVSDLVNEQVNKADRSASSSLSTKQVAKVIVDDIVDYVEKNRNEVLRGGPAPLSEEKLVEHIKREINR